MSLQLPEDTITAIATPSGRGGVGIVRVSGERSLEIARTVLGFEPRPRHAHYCPFLDEKGQQLDEGICLYFKAPNSFTGEDVVEFQAHGGPIVLDLLLRAITRIGARLALPGEFSQRAFLNDKLDLVQAEAIADLINSNSEQAARSALRSLQGTFSRRIDALVEALIELRMFVEAAIDFPEEEVDFLSDSRVMDQLRGIQHQLKQLLDGANQGSLLSEGITVVIAGRPNAGKSSLLNALAEKESAIVTDIAGTTRDVLKEQINIDGMPLHIIDTAGLRESDDKVEQIGIERAWQAINDADQILLVVDASEERSLDPREIWPEFVERLQDPTRLSLVRNKLDKIDEQPAIDDQAGVAVVSLSAKAQLGIDLLRAHLKRQAGFHTQAEGTFTARRRHIDALEKAQSALLQGHEQLSRYHAGELLAEELRIAQDALAEITGAFTPDDLLGKIFGSFCIGK